MLYRCIRKKDTGQWVNVLFTVDDESFSIPAASHVASIAASLSLNANELEAVDGGSDARTGTLIEQPVVSVTPTRQEELVAIGRDNWTDAQQKELIELLATGVVELPARE